MTVGKSRFNYFEVALSIVFAATVVLILFSRDLGSEAEPASNSLKLQFLVSLLSMNPKSFYLLTALKMRWVYFRRSSKFSLAGSTCLYMLMLFVVYWAVEFLSMSC